jgi:SAM-dependent methyltransferase
VTGPTVEVQRTVPTGERFEPTFMHGTIVEAEHLVRYAWATQFAPGRRTLDAACGVGYGSRMLADAGATEIVGVDLDGDAVAAARAAAGAGATFEVADLRKLPFGDDEFDLVVSFETIEHVPDPEVVLDEFRRVLRPDGLLVLSTPNRDVYTPGNPFHLRELTPSELEAALEKRFKSFRLRRQHTWVASAVFDDPTFLAGDNHPVGPVEVLKAFENEPGSETFTLALASDGELPEDGAVIDLSADIDLRAWGERLALADHAIEVVPKDADRRRQAEVERLREELGELRRKLVDKEAELGRYLEIGERLQAADTALADYVHSSEIVGSLSWKLTRPLRGLTALLRKLRR